MGKKLNIVFLGGFSAVAAVCYFRLFKNRKIHLARAFFSKLWFSEISNQWPGQAMSLEIEETLYQGKSDYQDILVFKSSTYGKVLVLDGAIQCTEKDEFAYQEMMTHLPLLVHPNPRRVLIIGGGDGGCLREITKHMDVQEIDICEIDPKVVEVSKKFLPEMASKFDDPRVKLHFADGYSFLKKKKHYDCIIVDSSDPEGPAENLFGAPFYEKLHESLTDDGVVAAQGECMWLDQPLIAKLKINAKQFHHRNFALLSVPSYPCGSIGVFICSKMNNPTKPCRELDHEIQEDLKYYTPQLHAASFVHPKFFDLFA